MRFPSGRHATFALFVEARSVISSAHCVFRNVLRDCRFKPLTVVAARVQPASMKLAGAYTSYATL
jgi:hypothetical protein